MRTEHRYSTTQNEIQHLSIRSSNTLYPVFDVGFRSEQGCRATALLIMKLDVFFYVRITDSMT